MYMRACCCLLAFAIGFELSADESIKNQVAKDIKHERYDHLGRLLKHNVGKKLSLTSLKAMAKKKDAKPLADAINATQLIKKYHTNLDCKSPELLQTALFIETTLPKYAKKHKYYLSKQRTGLAHTVEYDPTHDTTFIVLDGKKNYIGKGKKKTVHKAIHYTHSHPKVVARAVDQVKHSREHSLTKKLHGSPGIYTTVGFGKNTKGGKPYSTIYSKLYRPGSLQDALDKKYRLSTYEKMKVACDILEGLYSLHKNGIVHRDLGARNHFIDIPRGKPGRRKVSASIADLGRSTYAVRAADTKVQGNTTYTAPEGLYRKKLKGQDYYKTDVFAVGCVLYRLFYNKKAPWQEKSYVKDTKRSLYSRYKSMRHAIKRASKARRTHLATKHAKLTPKEEFELLVLRMVHTDPAKRGTAKELSAKMNKIFERVQ